MAENSEEGNPLDTSILKDITNGFEGSAIFADDFMSGEVSEIESLDSIPVEKEQDEEPKDDKTDIEKVEEDEEPVIPDKTDKDEDVGSPLKIFAEMLSEKGVIEYDPDSFEDSEEYLISLVDNKVKKGIDGYKESMPAKIKEMLEAYEDGMPIANFLEIESNIEYFESISADELKEDVQLQKEMVREYLTLKGTKKELIEKKLDRLIESGLLEDEAIDSRDEIIDIKRAEKAAEVQRKKEEAAANVEKQRKQLAELKTSIKNKEEIIPGFKITEQQKEKLYDGLTKVGKDNKTELWRKAESDPEFNLKVAYLALVLDWDFSKLEAKAKTAVSRNLKESIDSTATSKGQGGSGFGTEGKKPDYAALRRAISKI